MLRLLALLAFLLVGTPLPAGAASLAPGEPLTHGRAAALIEEELRARGKGERLAIEIESPALPLPNRATRPAELSLIELRHDPRSGRLVVHLGIRLESGEASLVELIGRARRLIEVAVPLRRIERGEILSVDDLETRWMPEGLASSASVAEPADLEGREARRILPAGRPIRAADLGTPRLVLRGEAVTLVYAAAGLELSAVGEALDTASEGELVRILNPDSNLIRKGVVIGRRLVRAIGAQEGRS